MTGIRARSSPSSNERSEGWESFSRKAAGPWRMLGSQMGPISTLTVAWAAVYGYVALYYGTLWAHRRGDREYLYFALLLGALSVHSLANAALLETSSVESARTALRISQLAVLVMGAYFIEFGHALADREVPARNWIYALAFLGVAIVGAGLYTAPATGPGLAHFGMVPGSVRITTLGRAHVGAMVLLSFWGLWRTWPAGRGDRDLRVVTLSLGVSLGSAFHDGLIRTGVIHGVYLLEHASMLTVGTMSYALLGRFVRVGHDLATRTEELESSTRNLRVTQELLVTKEQLAAVGELSAVIAHEVRNPLAVIKNAVSGLRRPTLKAEDRVTLREILGEETDRLNRLMHDLLAYAQPVTPKSEELGIGALIQRAVDRARQSSDHSHLVRFELFLEDGPSTLLGDASLLRHALVNVIDNALLAMPEGGTLTVRADASMIEHRAAVAISFTDQGEGMDTRVRDRATAPFFTTRPAGTGLGLAIVERVVRNHGGRIGIESSHGVGTTVTIRLPLERPSLLPPPRGERRVSQLNVIKDFES